MFESMCAFQFTVLTQCTPKAHRNFIYIAHLGIVIEQKIVLTFRIIFHNVNTFYMAKAHIHGTEPVDVRIFFHIHVIFRFGLVWFG